MSTTEPKSSPALQRHSLKRVTILVGAMLLLAVAGLWALRPGEPSYQGKRLSAWLRDFDKPYETTFFVSFQDMPKGALEAVRSMGVDSLPILLGLLKARDSAIAEKLMDAWEKQTLIKLYPTPAYVKQRRAAIGLAALGPNALPALPRLERMLGDEHTVIPASLAIAYLGPQGVPALTNALTNPNLEIRRACLVALAEVQSGGNLAIPALLASLRDQDVVIQGSAATALAVLRDSPEAAIPALTEVLASTSGARAQAAMALSQYGLAATSAIPSLLECLTSSESMTRLSARKALDRIGAETNLVVSTAIRALTNSDYQVRLFAVSVLRHYGPSALDAVPVLTACLNDPVTMVHEAASNALVSLDPQFATRSTLPTPASPP